MGLPQLIVKILVTTTPLLVASFREAYKRAANRSAGRVKLDDPAWMRWMQPSEVIHEMDIREACDILGLESGEIGKDIENVRTRYKKLMEANDPEKQGSFYLQSKIYRALEKVEYEFEMANEKKENPQEEAADKERL
mmetsp:Transcript_12733/g.19148  ORF Transcript_12733/g.19148 Transcript_12733/m.19148 type:complete len:137 (-) Transcript_12733:235-645(-)